MSVQLLLRCLTLHLIPNVPLKKPIDGVMGRQFLPVVAHFLFASWESVFKPAPGITRIFFLGWALELSRVMCVWLPGCF